MALSFTNGASNAMVDALTDLVDGGTIEVRTGSAPGAGNAATGTLLVTFTLPTPSFGSASAKVATLGSVSAATAAATGTAGYFRAKTSGGTAVFEGTVGTSGADLNLSSTSITSGGSVSITSGTLTGP